MLVNDEFVITKKTIITTFKAFLCLKNLNKITINDRTASSRKCLLRCDEKT